MIAIGGPSAIPGFAMFECLTVGIAVSGRTHGYDRLTAKGRNDWIVLPVAFVLLLPSAPLFAGAVHLSSIFRWLACLILSGLITATMMLILQLSITLG
jgi:hypothetical protein